MHTGFLAQFTELPALLRRPRLTRAAMDAARDEQVRRLVAHAWEHVPFYRRLWERHGVEPRHVRGAADLVRLPIVTKADLLAAGPDQLVARGVDRARLPSFQTSGSSGEPFTVWRTLREGRRLRALRLRAYYEMGLRPTQRAVRIGVSRKGGPNDRGAGARLLRRLGLYRRCTLDTFAAPAQIADWLAEFRPEVLGGYPGVIARVAEAHAAAGRSGSGWPRLVVTGAEVLTPAMRRTIESCFGARVFDTYGSMEFNLIAWECRESGAMHTCDDGVALEVLRGGRPAAPGERGEVVATNLHAFTMPFIRYRIGDIVTRGEDRCACGAPFGTIRELRGRMIDYFRLPGGRLVHPYEITDRIIWETVEWVRRYQAVQEAEDRIVVRIVPAFTPREEQLARIRRSVADYVGPGVEVRFDIVPEIPLEPSGKFRTSRSLVLSSYAGAEVGADWADS